MVEFPKTVEYTDTNKPAWMAVIKENDANPFLLRLTWEGYNRIKLEETNIEALLVDLQQALLDAGMTVADAYAIMNFIRFTADRVILTVDGTGTDNFEIILPAGLTVIDVRKATGESVPFFFNHARNSVVFTVTFASVETIEMFVGSISNLLNRSLQIMTTVMLTAGVITRIIGLLRETLQEVAR